MNPKFISLQRVRRNRYLRNANLRLSNKTFAVEDLMTPSFTDKVITDSTYQEQTSEEGLRDVIEKIDSCFDELERKVRDLKEETAKRCLVFIWKTIEQRKHKIL